MKNRKYLPLIEYALQRNCRVIYGSKHIKILSPRGYLITVISANGSNEPHNLHYLVRRVDQQLTKEITQ